MPETRRASQRKFHIIYKTTCMITGKWYVGMHSTDNINDGYLGSGMRLWKSIKKHGKENHNLEILEYLPDRKSLSIREIEIITEAKKNPMCMNIARGGEGFYDRPSSSEETRQKLSSASKNYVRTKEWYDKVVKTRTANKSYKHSEQTKQLLSEKCTGRKLSDEHKKKISESGKGAKRPSTTGEKIRAKLSKPCTIDGVIIFPSQSALINTLGSGKLGSRHPDFRFIKDNNESS